MNTEETGGGATTVLNKLRKTIEEGDYYQALNLYKSLYFRYSNKQRHGELRKLLVEGAGLMLDHRQVNAGTELGLLVLENYKKTEAPVTKETLGAVIEICKHYTKGDGASRRSFIKAAVSWSSNPSNNNQGSPELHDLFSQIYVDEKDYATAEKHFLRGTNAEQYANMLINWSSSTTTSSSSSSSSKDSADEKDLYIAKAVLQYLCLSNIRDANIVFKVFCEKSSARGPLIDLIKYLLLTVTRDAAPLFLLLRDKYPHSIARDATFPKYLDMIGKIYFDIEPKGSGGMGGLLSSFFKQLMDSESD